MSARERLDAFLGEVRRYVIQVAAQVDPDVPATQELADRLLTPLRDWKPSAASAPADVPEAPGAPAHASAPVMDGHVSQASVTAQPITPPDSPA